MKKSVTPNWDLVPVKNSFNGGTIQTLAQHYCYSIDNGNNLGANTRVLNFSGIWRKASWKIPMFRKTLLPLYSQVLQFVP